MGKEGLVYYRSKATAQYRFTPCLRIWGISPMEELGRVCQAGSIWGIRIPLSPAFETSNGSFRPRLGGCLWNFSGIKEASRKEMKKCLFYWGDGELYTREGSVWEAVMCLPANIIKTTLSLCADNNKICRARIIAGVTSWGILSRLGEKNKVF